MHDWEVKLGVNSPLYHHLLSPLRLQILSALAETPEQVFDPASLSLKTGALVRDIVACIEPLISEEIIESMILPQGKGYRLRHAGEGGLLSAVRHVLDLNRPMVTKLATVREKYFAGMIGVDDKMKAVFEMIRTIARTDATVLIYGETGTGKELVAQAVHELSSRQSKLFVAVNCATLPDTLFEAEMFGYEKGAFTGAYARKIGRFELAADGTLFLDEIADLTPTNQVKLLRVLQEKTFNRLGGSSTIRADVRLIAACNRPLEDLVENAEFREDLYYRINVFPIRLPSLRERKDDIPVLASDFLQRHGLQNFGDPFAKRFSDGALLRLQSHPWPGNVRELENIVTRLAYTVKGEEILPDDVERIIHPMGTPLPRSEGRGLKLEEMEKQLIRKVLHQNGWNIKKSSEILGISRVTLYKKIKQYQIERLSDSD